MKPAALIAPSASAVYCPNMATHHMPGSLAGLGQTVLPADPPAPPTTSHLLPVAWLPNPSATERDWSGLAYPVK